MDLDFGVQARIMAPALGMNWRAHILFAGGGATAPSGSRPSGPTAQFGPVPVTVHAGCTATNSAPGCTLIPPAVRFRLQHCLPHLDRLVFLVRRRPASTRGFYAAARLRQIFKARQPLLHDSARCGKTTSRQADTAGSRSAAAGRRGHTRRPVHQDNTLPPATQHSVTHRNTTAASRSGDSTSSVYCQRLGRPGTARSPLEQAEMHCHLLP